MLHEVKIMRENWSACAVACSHVLSDWWSVIYPGPGSWTRTSLWEEAPCQRVFPPHGFQSISFWLVTLRNAIHLSPALILSFLTWLPATLGPRAALGPLIFLHNTSYARGGQALREYRLQLDEVQECQTDTSGVKGFGAPCQAISPIMECGRLTTFINIQMRRNEAAQEKCVAQLLSGGHVRGKTRAPPWLPWYAAWARRERSRCSGSLFCARLSGFWRSTRILLGCKDRSVNWGPGSSLVSGLPATVNTAHLFSLLFRTGHCGVWKKGKRATRKHH